MNRYMMEGVGLTILGAYYGDFPVCAHSFCNSFDMYGQSG